MPAPDPGTMRLGGYQGPASILTQGLQDFAAELAPGADGLQCRVEADVTLTGQTARWLFDSVERGTHEGCYLASGYLAARVPELALLDLPFSVHDRAAALQALDGEVGAAIARAVAASTGLRVLAFWDNGFRHLTNGVRPIRSPADCRGLTVRTLDSADYRAALQALGFDVVSIDVRDLVQAVASGRVDAQENPLTNAVLFEIWRHHRHLSLTGHLFGVALLVVRQAWFDALPAARRARLQDAARSATTAQRRRAAEQDVQALAALRAAGVEVLPPEAIDLEAMQRCVEAQRSARIATLPPALWGAYLQPVPARRRG